MANKQRVPRVSGFRLVRAFKKGGWKVVRKQGDDFILKHPTRWGRAKIRHDAADVPPGTLSNILRTSGLTVGELWELL